MFNCAKTVIKNTTLMRTSTGLVEHIMENMAESCGGVVDEQEKMIQDASLESMNQKMKTKRKQLSRMIKQMSGRRGWIRSAAM